ncbi:solute carrier family 22 member 4 [Lingula anatina]|uniref:Solute carrier family 22 member 4 n=1 Tax=Lingula anatina TaxID=7574 RepID=A0A1S3K6J1_LINAN|nr:solute carrier family 22 member 4 [Lingula anatina]|eukprot:XP_013418049.1 solute carrier family 22 member 4 [Lingula anatina]
MEKLKRLSKRCCGSCRKKEEEDEEKEADNKMTDLEHVLAKVGQMGWYQLSLFLIISLSDIPVSWAMLSLIFTGDDASWRCPIARTNVTSAADDYLTDNSTTLFDSLLYDVSSNVNIVSDGTLSNVSNVTKNSSDMYTYNTCTADNQVCPGIEFTSESSTIVTEWNLVCNLAPVSDQITSLQMIGVFFGSFIYGQLADSFGRKKAWFGGILLMCLTGFAQIYAPTWYVFAILRLITGISLGGTIVVGFVYPMEFIGIRWRAFTGSIGLWPVGLGALAAFGFTIKDWKQIMLATTLPGLALLLFWFYIPESPRWLVTRGRYKEAEEIMQRIARRNKKEMPDFAEFVANYEANKNQAKARDYRIHDLFRTPRQSRLIVMLTYIMFSMALFVYTMGFNVKNLPGGKAINFAIGFGIGYPTSLFSIYLNNCLGRRWTFIGLTALGGVLTLSVILLDVFGVYETAWLAVALVSTLGRTCVLTGWTAAMIISSELLPTPIRDIGVAVAMGGSRLGSIVAPQLVYLSKLDRRYPFIIGGVFAIGAAITGWFLPETKGQALEDDVPKWTWCFCCPCGCARNDVDEDPKSVHDEFADNDEKEPLEGHEHNVDALSDGMDYLSAFGSIGTIDLQWPSFTNLHLTVPHEVKHRGKYVQLEDLNHETII